MKSNCRVADSIQRSGLRAAVVACAALLLHACGGSGNAGNTGSTNNATASSVPTPPVTGSATLSWTPPTTREDGTSLTGLAGYKVYYGTTPNDLGTTITLQGAGQTGYVISDLGAGTYYFVVTAVDSSGGESSVSNMVSKTI